jgi:hypothetical protein
MKTKTINDYIMALTDFAEQIGDDRLAYAVDQFRILLNSSDLPNDLISNMKSYAAKSVKTLDTHWDCECKERYIHSKADRTTCPVCGTEEADSPDSRINEMTECNIFQLNK